MNASRKEQSHQHQYNLPRPLSTHSVPPSRSRNNYMVARAAYCSFCILGLGLLQDGGEVLVRWLRYCGSPTFRTNSANRGSERIGSSKKAVFKPSSHLSCS